MCTKCWQYHITIALRSTSTGILTTHEEFLVLVKLFNDLEIKDASRSSAVGVIHSCLEIVVQYDIYKVYISIEILFCFFLLFITIGFVYFTPLLK